MDETFRGGMPYGPDLDRLDAAFPIDSLTEGRIVTHAELAGAMDIQQGSPRYYSVIRAWIRKQRITRRVILEWVHAVGLKVLNPAEVLSTAEDVTHRKIRQTQKAISRFSWVDRNRLNSQGQSRLDHQTMVYGRLTYALSQAKRESAIELAPVQSLPKRAISDAR